MSQNLSLSEIDALCRKAARGAGYGWGMAEEAGRSARWLAAFGFQGAEALAAWLAKRISGAPEQYHPSLQNGVWTAQKGVCPLTAGTLISDHESVLLSGRGFAFANVQQPLLMLSMVARIVENREDTLLFSIGEHNITCTSQGIVCADDFPWHRAAADVRCYLAEGAVASPDDTLEPASQSRAVDATACTTLNELAYKTYAPATEASRLAGAGAGTSDND